MENNESFLEGNGIIILILFFLMFGGGFGGWGGNAMQNSLTRAELTDGLNFQNLNNNMNSMQTQMCNGFGGVERTILEAQNANAVSFCGVNRNIDSAKYDALLNTNRLEAQIHAEGESTRALITGNTIQDLRDKLAEKDNLLQSANLTLANSAQTSNILNQMGRYIPYAGCGTCCNGSYGW